MKELKLASPWSTYVNELRTFFKDDEEVRIFYDETKYAVKVFAENRKKEKALMSMLPPVKEFGNVKLTIDVIPSNSAEEDETEPDEAEKLNNAFHNNPAVECVVSIAFVGGGVFIYVICKKEVVQFFNDQMDDINGVKSMLYQDIAKDLFNIPAGVFFCTAKHETEATVLGASYWSDNN